MKIKKGKSMCFFSAKGGVGKTVNILNLAGILEQLDKKVLIIDFDLGTGGVAASLNKRIKMSVYDMGEDILNNRFTKVKDYVSSYDKNIDILASPKDPRDANKMDVRVVNDIIKKAELEYDAVLIDTNHTLSDINLVILQTVTKILFVTTNDPIDLKNLKSILAIFKELEFNNYKVMLNNSRDPFKSYFSMYDIKHILKNNVDYTLSVDLFLRDMEKYIMDGKIISLDKRFSRVCPKDYQTFLVIATDLLGDDEE